MDPVLTREEVESQSALIRHLAANNPAYNPADTDQALQLATACIEAFGGSTGFDTSLDIYDRNMELATILLVDKFYVQRQPEATVQLIRGVILERVGDYMVQYDPLSNRSEFYNIVDSEVESLLNDIMLSAADGGRSYFGLRTDHVFSGDPYPGDIDTDF